MEFYVNDSFLGRSGVEETSKYFFNKSASDLTLPEAALIIPISWLRQSIQKY